MERKIDNELLAGFIEEAKGYLPTILGGIQAFRRDSAQLDSLIEAHRLVHIIKGASSMVGLATLSHVAYVVEEAVDDLVAGTLSMTSELDVALVDAVAQIESYLDGVSAGRPPDRNFATEVIGTFRRLRGLPEAGDRAAVDAALEPIRPVPAAAKAAPRPESRPEPAPAAPAAPGPEGEAEGVSGELRQAFLVEAEDHMRAIAAGLAQLEREPGRSALLQQVRRAVHTLKGAAGLVGFSSVTRLSHRMEDLLDSLYEAGSRPSPEAQGLLFATADTLEDLLEAEPEAPEAVLTDLYARYAALLGDGGEGGEGGEESGSLGEEKAIDVEELIGRGEADTAPAPAAPRAPVRSADVVRVPIERVDELVRLVSELVINRSTFEQQYRRLSGELDELDPSIRRLRRVSTRLETEYEARALGNGLGGTSPAIPGSAHAFDELELDRYTEFHLLARELAETTSDLTTAGGELTDFAGDFESSLTRQGHLTSEIQDRLIRLRMVPLANLATRLSRTVRVTAQQQGKAVDLVLEGEDVELDKVVLEQMADPLLHILRNAVDHGIEPAALRRVTGKPERARVVLRAGHEATQVVIEVTDDGAGLDPEILRAAAVRGGWVSESDAATLKEEDLFSLVFLPGFSTAGEVSEISGRGVGLDIVKSSVAKLKGTVSVRSQAGRGTTVTVRLPMTLAITRVLLVRAGGQTFAVPLAAIKQILRLDWKEISRVGDDTLLSVAGEAVPLSWLAALLGRGRPPEEEGRRVPILIIGAAGRKVAWAVDELLEQREVVVKTLGSHLRRVPGITGATLMGDGSVVLILNPGELAAETRRRPVPVVAEKLAAARRAPTEILIVDDSSSVRRILSNLVRSAGWSPSTARDGLEALEMIQRAPRNPDLILLDIEMPRMDGYELASSLRAEPAYRSIPIVMVTSRAGEKHRRKALEVGVADYVVKPYRDETLLELIRKRTQEARTAP